MGGVKSGRGSLSGHGWKYEGAFEGDARAGYGVLEVTKRALCGCVEWCCVVLCGFFGTRGSRR